ncbi:hypothetical protein [Rhodococcus sp. SGAir0479]|uniref:hypothetical protein n=1 Tax=Rhodococcus sp. SGAir0479 TaxID=2567884 RepID=UPI0010CCFD0B|nr:hypothetical protein [Rhodococcus sp. SGAir0479]QCQ93373.1 hypothetical protein E7742_20560 [Rhodococcus sp. SGAir0479]
MTPTTAFACSCAYPPDGSQIVEQISHAASIFTGTATAERVAGQTAFYEFDVREVFDGDIGTTTTVSSSVHDAACGRGFEIGSEYLVFTSTYDTQGAPWSVNSCSATTESSNDRTREAAVTVYGAPHAPDPHRDSVGIDDVGTARWWMLAATGGAVWLIALAVRRRRSNKP